MPSVNKVIIVGNLTRDPVSKQIGTGTVLAEFGMAMNRKFQVNGEDREEVCFVDVSAFGRQAEVIQKYCMKGKSLYVEGRLKYDSWDDKNGHGKRSKLTVVVENFQFLGGKNEGAADGADDHAASGQQSRRGPGKWDGAHLPPRKQNPPPTQPFGDQQEFRESEIPF